jgi:hypothetical protein
MLILTTSCKTLTVVHVSRHAIVICLFVACFFTVQISEVRAQNDFPDAHDDPIPGWTGPVFKLRQDYPSTPPPSENYPWKQFNFRTQPLDYLRSVLQYAYEGNIAVNWEVQNNTVRGWYHAPWLHFGNNGREFVHGLTRERSSRPRELHPQQTQFARNYAVSVYNPPGGYIIGQVWADPDSPNAAAARFPDGTVAIKLLFTQASVAQVPFLKNTVEWQGHLANATGTTRSIQTARLLQVDVAVRDTRANSTTGWVFGTFAYDGEAAGATPWERMVPVGLMWGNDPTLTPQRFNSGSRPTQTFINPDVRTPQHLGWLGRLNGPVDNPVSACLSCHSTAQHRPARSPFPPTGASDTEKMRWFRNIRSGQPFDQGQISLDYSLQLAQGIENFFEINRVRRVFR